MISLDVKTNSNVNYNPGINHLSAGKHWIGEVYLHSKTWRLGPFRGRASTQHDNLSVVGLKQCLGTPSKCECVREPAGNCITFYDPASKSHNIASTVFHWSKKPLAPPD